MDKRIIDYFEGKLSADERKKLLQEIRKDDDLQKDMSSFQNLYASLSFHPAMTDQQVGKKGYKELIRQKRREKQGVIFRWSLGYAAAFLIIFSLGWLMHDSFINRELSLFSAGMQEVYIPPGQRGRITLPDGTQVWMNAGSTLSYPAFFNEERRVELSGEAWFDVAKNEDLPFIVSTEQVDIQALGTQFNVYAYHSAAYVMTTLLSGKVRVSDKKEKKSLLLENPNEQAMYKNQSFEFNVLKDKDILLWREGIYSFKNEPFESILKKLEIYYDTKIRIKDPEILEFEYTGKFRQLDGLMEILRLIQIIHPFKIHKNEELNEITLSK